MGRSTCSLVGGKSLLQVLHPAVLGMPTVALPSATRDVLVVFMVRAFAPLFGTLGLLLIPRTVRRTPFSEFSDPLDAAEDPAVVKVGSSTARRLVCSMTINQFACLSCNRVKSNLELRVRVSALPVLTCLAITRSCVSYLCFVVYTVILACILSFCHKH